MSRRIGAVGLLRSKTEWDKSLIVGGAKVPGGSNQKEKMEMLEFPRSTDDAKRSEHKLKKQQCQSAAQRWIQINNMPFTPRLQLATLKSRAA